MNTSYTSQLRREFDNMALLSDIASPVPNFITTGDPPKRQRSLQDNEGVYFELEKVYPKKQQKTYAALQMKGTGKSILVKEKGSKKLILIDEDAFNPETHERDNDQDILSTFAFEGNRQRDEVDEGDTTEYESLNQNDESNMFEKTAIMAYINERTPEKGFGTPKKPIDGIEWAFSKFMGTKVDSGTFRLKLVELGQTFCYFCMGFGHSKHDCLTQKKCKHIFKGLPISAKLNFIVNQVLSNDKIVEHEYKMGIKGNRKQPWVLFRVVSQFAWYEIRKQHDQGAERQECISEMFASILSSLSSISIQCLYCQGFGHGPTEDLFQKQPKGSKIGTEGTKKTKTADFYDTTSFSCKTKVRFEQLTMGEFNKKSSITRAIADWRSLQKYKTSPVEDNSHIKTTEALISYADVMQRNTVQAKHTFLNPTDGERLRQIAIATGALKQQNIIELAQQQQAHAEEEAALEERALVMIERAPEDYFLGNGFQDMLVNPDFAQSQTEENVAREIAKGTYRPIEKIYAVVLGKQIIQQPAEQQLAEEVKVQIPQYDITSTPTPLFWFDCCSPSAHKKLRPDIIRLMTLVKMPAYTDEYLKVIVKGTTAAGKNFRTFMYALAITMNQNYQLFTLRCLCNSDAAYERLVYILAATANAILKKQTLSTFEGTAWPDTDKKVQLTILFFRDIGSKEVRYAGDMEKFKQQYPLYTEDDKTFGLKDKLNPAYLYRAIIEPAADNTYLTALKKLSIDNKAVLKEFVKENPAALRTAKKTSLAYRVALVKAAKVQHNDDQAMELD